MSLIAHYRADVHETVIGQIMGPDELGGYVEAVAADYDATAGVTTVRFRPVPPADLIYLTEDYAGQRRLMKPDVAA